MAEHSSIEWTDATWNPVTGCSVISPGCTHCYAMKLAGTRLQHHPSRAGLTAPSKAGPVWTGEVRLNEAWLDQPLRWRRPRRIFVCAHGDLFHEDVPDAWIDQVFARMALSPQHTFQVLTKRAARMRAYATDQKTPGRIARAILDLLLEGKVRADDRWPVKSVGPDPDDPDDVTVAWPLRNVWKGVSAEDQARADQRTPELLETPAAVRFVSLEPLLGPVDMSRWLGRHSVLPRRMAVDEALARGLAEWRDGLDWVIVGGETDQGVHKARPAHPDWARSLRDQCAAAGVPFFFKQMTKKAPIPADLLVREWPDA